jgi:hypothetical protein
MLVVVRKTYAVGCCTARHGGHAQQLIRVRSHCRHRAAVGSSHDAQWALGQQALRGYRPWEHIPAVQLENVMYEPVLLVVQETTGCR